MQDTELSNRCQEVILNEVNNLVQLNRSFLIQGNCSEIRLNCETIIALLQALYNVPPAPSAGV